jgi:2-polyprenyl-3-methyl-5-hydroxy-6-metoxy-1,4-benzoquinol methylase
MNDDPSHVDPYAEIAELYDLEHDEFHDDLQFYLHSIAAVGDPVLELGCGTGRLLRPIADAGFHVTGLDRSAPMLERARRSLRGNQKKRISFWQGAMTDSASAPGGPFGTVIFSLNGMLHLANPAEQRKALVSA